MSNEYQKIKSKVLEVLSPLGFSEEKPVTADGSMQCILSKGDRKFMVQWDVEENFGWVESWVDGDWVMLESIVPESPEPEFAGHLDSLIAELKSCL